MIRHLYIKVADKEEDTMILSRHDEWAEHLQWCVYARMVSKERRRNASYCIQRNYLRRLRQTLFRIRNTSTQTVKYSQILHAVFASITLESSRRQLGEILWWKTNTGTRLHRNLYLEVLGNVFFLRKGLKGV